MGEYLLISDAAKQVKVESHVLRYWEEELHLPIKRNELGHRYYTKEDVERFKEIKSMKERGLQLKAIKMILKDGRLDVLPEEREKEPVEARKEPAEVRTPHMAIEIVDKPVDKEMPVQPQERICTVPEKEGLQSESREEKAKRLQWILQQLIREAVRENNQDLCRELKESMVKELDYQFRSREEREEERDRRLEQRSEEYYQKMDELLRKRPGDNCGNSRKRREGRKWKKSPQRSQTKKIPAGKLRQKKRKGISFSEMPSPGYVLNQELILCDSTNRALTCAGTAADALICIDFKLSVAHADSANGALCLTSSTCYTSITNNKCHNLFLLFCVYQISCLIQIYQYNY